MSESRLYGITPEFKGVELEEYSNALLFFTDIMDVLYVKYMPEAISDLTNVCFLADFSCGLNKLNLKGVELWKTLKERVETCNDLVDRVIWEMGGQSIFYSKDKELIISCIEKFFTVNAEYMGRQTLSALVLKRVNEFILSLKELDVNAYPYFVFDVTSVTADVHRWFGKRDEEQDKFIYGLSLKEQEKVVTGFVIIENGKVVDFKTNLEFFGK